MLNEENKFQLINASENRRIFILYNLVDKAYLNIKPELLLLLLLLFVVYLTMLSVAQAI